MSTVNILRYMIRYQIKTTSRTISIPPSKDFTAFENFILAKANLVLENEYMGDMGNVLNLSYPSYLPRIRRWRKTGQAYQYTSFDDRTTLAM